MKKIFLVTYGGGHVKIIEPLAHELLKDTNIEFKILALTSAYASIVNKFPDGIVKKISDYSFLFDDSIEEILQLGIKFVGDNYSKNSLVTKEETIYYIGLSFYDLITRVGESEAYKQYKEKKRQAFLPISIMDKILRYEMSDIVISTTSPRFEQASFIAANNLGLQTIEILDLFGNLNPLPEAKHIVCMNKSISNQLTERGVKDKKYYHFGQPAIENSVKQIMALDKKEIYKKLQLLSFKPTILYASQPPLLIDKDGRNVPNAIDYNKMNNYIFKFLEQLHTRFDVNILMRIHPNEDPDNYKTFFDTYDFVTYTNNILTLYESIAVSDLVITHCSTVALEAVLSKRYTFTYQNDFSEGYPFFSMTQAPFIHSKNINELLYNLSTLLESNIQSTLLLDNPLFEFGSVDKIMKLIKEL